VLLADDQDLIREALRALLAQEPRINVVGQARNGFDAIDEARRLKPDVVLMDVRMPGLSGPDATARIRTNRGLSATRVLILTTFEDADVVRACMNAGADGFIGKGVAASTLVEAIFAVARGDSPLSARAARAIGTRTAPTPTPATGIADLTKRELDIIKLAALGLSNDEIGRQLSISPATAKTHVRNAMKKLRVHDRAQLVVLVHRTGLGR